MITEAAASEWLPHVLQHNVLNQIGTNTITDIAISESSQTSSVFSEILSTLLDLSMDLHSLTFRQFKAGFDDASISPNTLKRLSENSYNLSELTIQNMLSLSEQARSTLIVDLASSLLAVANCLLKLDLSFN